MVDEMTSIERIEKAVDLEMPDRVPVVIKVSAHAARIAGITPADYYGSINGPPFNIDRTENAFRTMWEKYGGWDAVWTGSLFYLKYSGIFPLSLPTFLDAKLPGVDCPANTPAIFELIEEPAMGEDGYDLLIDEGWIRFLSLRKMGLLRTFLKPYMLKEKIESILSYWYHDQKVALMAIIGSMLPFDSLSYMRGLKNFLIDLHKRPEKIKEVCDASIEGFIKSALISAEGFKKYTNYMSIWCHRGGNTYFSPKLFGELYFPYLKRMVIEFAKAGYISSLHLDSDYTLNLEYFRELPKKKVIIELDGITDIFKAKEILGGHLCIAGDVPATLLAFGTPEDVKKYCKKLIDVVGEGGGFILEDGCEVPINAKFENVKVLVDMAKTYGRYKK